MAVIAVSLTRYSRAMRLASATVTFRIASIPWKDA